MCETTGGVLILCETNLLIFLVEGALYYERDLFCTAMNRSITGGLFLGGPNVTAQRGEGECVLMFPGPAEVVPGEVSGTVGVWIQQTGAVARPFTRCADAR